MDLKFFLLVASGGAIGSIFRALILLFGRSCFPWQTLITNLLGAFVIGICLRYWESHSNPDFFRAFWMIGVCGGFTTFSTFGLDMFNFIKEGQWVYFFAYTLLSVIGTLLCVLLGYKFLNWLSF